MSATVPRTNDDDRRPLKRSRGRALRALSILLVLTLTGGLAVTSPAAPDNGAAPRPEGCGNCHRDFYQQTIRKSHVHPPFRQRQCESCHLLDEAVAPSAMSDTQHKPKIPSRIKWVGESQIATDQHWFALPARNLNTILVAKPRDSGNASCTATRIPALQELASFSISQEPPKISNVRVTEVQRGLFLSVTIGWETDKIADSAVVYGLFEKKQTTPRGNAFNREHRVTLTGLLPDRQYQYAAVSRDPLGNETTSEAHTFSTAKSQGTVPARSGVQAGGETAAEMKSLFYRFEDSYLVQVSLDPPAPVLIGTNEPGGEDSDAGAIRISATSSLAHAGYNKSVGINLVNCEPCHGDYTKSLSHPVNVYPKQGMVIPAEYRTLPDGRIICLSCHDPHASTHKHLLIKSSKRELCIGCHRNFT